MTRGPDADRAAGSAPGRGTKARAAPAAARPPHVRLDQAPSRPRPTVDRADWPSAAAAGSRPAQPRRHPIPTDWRALAEERDFLLRSLRDLEAEHDAGDVDDADYAALKDDYTARAAAVIRAIEADHAGRAPARPIEAERSAPASAAGWWSIFSVGAGVLVAQWSGQRGGGDTITGGIRGDTRDELLAARQECGATASTCDAIKDYDKVLQLDPANTEALAYKGWMLRIVSLPAPAASSAASCRPRRWRRCSRRCAPTPTTPPAWCSWPSCSAIWASPQAALAELGQGRPPASSPSFMSRHHRPVQAQMQASSRSSPPPPRRG